MIDRKELKAQAREAIRATRPHPAWVTLVVLVILLVTQVLSLTLNGDIEAYRVMLENAMNGEFVLVQAEGTTGVFPWLLTLALDLMTMAISTGYCLYALRVSRRQNPGFGDVFDAFGFFFRVIVLNIVRGLLISLLSAVYAFPAGLLAVLIDPVLASFVCLPLFIPMFVLLYAYRLADFILFDNPAFPAVSCLSLSRAAMKGRKWELFRLDLTFLGWGLLCIVPFVILWVRPYRLVTTAGYYDKVMPGFLEEMKNRPTPAMVDRTPPGAWHIPGESSDVPDESEDDSDDDSDWF